MSDKYFIPGKRVMTEKPEDSNEVQFFCPNDPEGAYTLCDLMKYAEAEHLDAIAEHLHELETQPINYEAVRQCEDAEVGEAIADALILAANSGGAKTVLNAINAKIRSAHRSLQNDIYEGICKLIRDVASDYDAKRYDGRNQVYVRLFKAIADEFYTEDGAYKAIDVNKLPPDTVGY